MKKNFFLNKLSFFPIISRRLCTHLLPLLFSLLHPLLFHIIKGNGIQFFLFSYILKRNLENNLTEDEKETNYPRVDDITSKPKRFGHFTP